ncbi:MAG: hypothetical protein M0Z71_16290 [Nitrospiraceae bacterium]|nr:hypothetical protein [Nitrospiraceae bacterium]MDA8433965.1 hypothetical protein [Nitrospiraceae bacterium]
MTVTVGIEVKSLLIGESADPETVSAMHNFLSSQPEVAQVYRLITLQLGSELMVSAKVRMKEPVSALKLIEDINRVEAALRTNFPQTRWIFFGPDVRD